MPKTAKDRRKAKKAAESEKPIADVPIVDKKEENSLKAQGAKFFSEQKFEQALESFSKAIEEDKDNHALFSNRCATYIALKKFENALSDAEKCIQLKPDWAKGYYRRGEALEYLLRYPEAFRAFNEGLKIDPNDALIKTAVERMSALLQELKITEEQMAAQANPESDKFETMIKWMKDGGCQFPMLYMKYYSEDYRGVHALTRVSEGQLILYVPLSHIMTSELAKASDIGKKLISSGCELRSEHSYLASYLLQEKYKGQDSFWYPYINILPVKYRNMPIFFTKEELTWLKGSFTEDKITNRWDSLKAEYDNLCKAVPDYRRFTHLDFVWARLAVITRIFGFSIKGKKTDGLVAYADMLNHKKPRNNESKHQVDDDDTTDTKWTFDDNMGAQGGFTIHTVKPIARGAEVYDSYGRKCNSRFFINYGFTIENNEDNEVVMRFGIPKSDPHYNTKIGFLGGYERSANREYQVPANYTEKKTKEMFSFLRFVHAADQELALLPSDGAKMDEIEPISVRNELAVLQHIKKSAQIVMQGFDTSMEWDRKYLEDHPWGAPETDNNLRNCVVMRYGEKTVLQWYIDLCDRATPYLELSWKDLKRSAAKSYQSSNAFDQYITQVVVPLVKPKGN